MIRPAHVRAGLRVLRRHLRYAGGNPRKLLWVARRVVNLARDGAIAGVLERHVVQDALYADYAQWCARHEPGAGHDYGPRLAALARRPRISILMPVHDVDVAYLEETIASVREQCYSDWELVAVDDASGDARVRECLAQAAACDARIVLHRRDENGGIAQATNDALALAAGEYCAFLDHDDRIAPDALLCIAEAIGEHPSCDLFFSDEDKLAPGGARARPYFKPDWDGEWMRTTNCTLHFMAVRSALLRELGGLALGIDGAQDWDLALRVEEARGRECIHHIPYVLYHWREIPGSTAAASFEKPALAAAQRRVIESTLRRRGESGTAMLMPSGWRIEYALPDPPPLVSVVIPTRDRVDLLRACVESIRSRTTYPSYEIVIVDNGSADPEAVRYLEALAASSGARVVRSDAPFNYAALCNLGVREARGPLVALVNNDVEVISPHWLTELASLALRPGVGLAGATLYYPDLTLQHAGVILGLNGVGDRPWIGTPRGFAGPYGRARATREVGGVITACAVVVRERYIAAGGMNESLAVSCNDLDLGLRLTRNGHRTVVSPYAELLHRESASRGLRDDPHNEARSREEEARFAALWPRELRADPWYNPNLALAGTAYALAWPPRVPAR
jgi:glycosyltransferase involved in cell wall biosynthesis